MTIALSAMLSLSLVRVSKFTRRRFKSIIALASLLAGSCILVAWDAHSRPREWAADEVPVAFWSWQSEVPSQASVQRAIDGVGARALFLRAGQIDYQRGKVRRIRPVTGALPQGIALHLVYNATRDLLAQFEGIDSEALASTICNAYTADLSRASAEGVRVSGLQLDIDVPTRLLSRYEQLLRMIRLLVPDGTTLSITGLPTWMSSSALSATIDAVNFWIPQCYGATIPERLNRARPIASRGEVANAIDRARKLAKPFYAGLPAYGYTIHFDREGRRLEVSGSLDPEIVASAPSLELVERGAFDAGAANHGEARPDGEWRYIYCAKETCVVGELAIREGEWLMLDLPTPEGLLATASAVRQQAGEQLLGICIFRLPTAGDSTTLTVEEIAAALSGRAPEHVLELKAWMRTGAGPLDRPAVVIECSNTGAASGLLGEGALSLDLGLEGERLGKVGPSSFDSSATMFVPSSANGHDQMKTAVVCGTGRANIVRLAKRRWSPGMSASVNLEFSASPPELISAVVTIRVDEMHVRQERHAIKVERTIARE